MINDTKTTFRSIESTLRGVVEAKNRERLNAERAAMMQTIGADIVKALTPILMKIAQQSLAPLQELSDIFKKSISDGMKDLKIETPTVKLPPQEKPIVNVTVPPIRVPEPKVTVNVPETKIPEMKFPSEMDVNLQGVDFKNPLPVQLRDKDGKPLNLLEGLTQLVIGGGGGGGGRGVVQLQNSGTYVAPYSTVSSGTKTTTSGVAVALGSTAVKKVEIVARENNTGIVVIGGADVVAAQETRKGIPLVPFGAATIFVDNLSKIYLDAVENNDGVTFTYYA